MIHSMTGYGRAQKRTDGMTYMVELRSLNHRYLNLAFKLPDSIRFLEPAFRKILNKKISRGQVDLTIQFQEGEKALRNYVLNKRLAKKYYAVLGQLQEELGLKEPITLAHFAHQPGLIQVIQSNGVPDKRVHVLEHLVSRAADALESSRRAEGKAIQRELLSRISGIEKSVDRIRKRVPQVTRQYQKRLQSRIGELSSRVPLDPGRLAQEVAIFAERSDISEEVGRLHSHLGTFRESLQRQEPAGRKLDFLAQEISREINTAGSKANDLDIANEVLLVKSELAKVREVVQNIE